MNYTVFLLCGIYKKKRRCLRMNNFLKGILVGAGIGLLVAPMRGEEFRKMLAQRFSELSKSMPQNEQLSQYTQQVSNTVSQSAGNLKDYAQQAASTVKNSASNLSDIAQNAASTVKGSASNLSDIAQNAASTAKQTGQDVADTTKQAAASAKSNNTPSTKTNTTGTPTTTNTTTSAPFPTAYPEYVNPETKPNNL